MTHSQHLLSIQNTNILPQPVVGTAILETAGLSFLGLGAQPPTPEWGTMLNDARPYIRDGWWLITFPGIAIIITVLGFNLLGDGLRDVLDPRQRTLMAGVGR